MKPMTLRSWPTQERDPWSMEKCIRTCLLPIVAFVVLSACQRSDSFETRFALTGELATADIHFEPTELDFGSAEARAFLDSGWSWNERSFGTSFVWGTGPISELHFFLSSPRDLGLEMRCFPYSFEGAPTQEIRPTLNDIPLEPISLESGPRTYQIQVPAEALKRGINRLTFEYQYSQSPETGSRGGKARSLAVGWDWLRFHLEPVASPSEITASETGISMPFGSGIDFYFEARPQDRLVFDQISGLDETAAALEISLLTDRGTLIESLDLRSNRQGVTIDLPLDEEQAVKLSFLAAAQAETPDPLFLRGPRIESPSSQREPAVEPGFVETEGLQAGLPDILLYVVDTMRADHLGLYGYARDVSPEIDRFGKEAVVFDHAMAQTSWTKPAVASIFTGLRTTAHGVNHREQRLASRFSTMAELLSAANYRTIAFTTNAYFSADSGLRQGFDEFALEPARADRVNQQIFDWLDRDEAGSPLFLYVHTIDPHAPYDPPEQYRRTFAPDVSDPEAGSFEHIRGLAFGEIPKTPQTVQDLMDLYDAEIAFADRQFGLLLEDLRRRGLYDQMLIVLASDHGEGFYEHGIQGHGWDLYRESIQVPMLLKLPGTTIGQRVAEPVQQIDLLPTLLELAGLEAPTELQGRSLAPLLDRKRLQAASGDPVFSYLDYEGRRGMSVIWNQWKLIEPLSASFARSRELYDRVQDPEEQIDLAVEYPVLAGYLATLIRRQLLELDQLPEIETMDFDDETKQQLKALGYLQ